MAAMADQHYNHEIVDPGMRAAACSPGIFSSACSSEKAGAAEGINFADAERAVAPKKRSVVEDTVQKVVEESVEVTRAKVGLLIKKMGIDVPWYIIDPRKSRYLAWFDAVAGICLIYVSVATPLEVGYVPLSGKVDTLFLINRVTDAVFIAEMCVQFFVMFPSNTQKGVWVHNPQKIVVHYLTGWFTLDILSILISLVLDIITLDDGNSDAKRLK